MYTIWHLPRLTFYSFTLGLVSTLRVYVCSRRKHALAFVLAHTHEHTHTHMHTTKCPTVYDWIPVCDTVSALLLSLQRPTHALTHKSSYSYVMGAVSLSGRKTYYKMPPLRISRHI